MWLSIIQTRTRTPDGALVAIGRLPFLREGPAREPTCRTIGADDRLWSVNPDLEAHYHGQNHACPCY